MTTAPEADWDPVGPDVQADQRATYDAMRERCPVAYSGFSGWTLFRHADVERVLHDHDTFSNAVSKHLSVPNGMDPPQHTAFRSLIEPYLAPERVSAFEPRCREIARALVADLVERGRVDVMDELAGPFAARVQCTFLGWPASMDEPLREWARKNHAATLAQDRPVMAAIAREFADHVRTMLESGRDRRVDPASDVAAALSRETVAGRPLRFDELVSILRNWTMGEVGTIAAAVGILAHRLASDEALQRELRGRRARLPDAIEEILRLDGPLASNRRITTRPVELNGRFIGAGARVSINWIAANRDGRTFDAPGELRLDRDQSRNLLYGAGIHVCPGAALSRMELRVVVDALLDATRHIRHHPVRPAKRARFPAAGFAELPLLVE